MEWLLVVAAPHTHTHQSSAEIVIFVILMHNKFKSISCALIFQTLYRGWGTVAAGHAHNHTYTSMGMGIHPGVVAPARSPLNTPYSSNRVRERESHVRAYECLMKILYHQNNLKAHLLYARNTKNGQQQQQQICIFCLHSELCEITHKDNNLRAGKIWGAMASARSLDIVIAFVIIRMSPESAFSR